MQTLAALSSGRRKQPPSNESLGAPVRPVRRNRGGSRTLPPVAQAKLRIGALESRQEQEAERIAHQVMQSPEPEVRAVARPSEDGRAAPAMVTQALRSPGAALDPGTQHVMESSFGWDFSSVRVHTDPLADRSARSVGASAYAAANHVVFRSGQYAPQTPAGRRLLAHELAHVTQGNASIVSRAGDGSGDVVPRQIALEELGFLGDHVITSVPGVALGSAKGPKVDDPDGSEPVWSASRRLVPVAYNVGAAPRMFCRFKVEPSIPTAVDDTWVQATIGGTVVGIAKGLSLAGHAIEPPGSGAGMVPELGGTTAVPGGSEVGHVPRNIRFQVSIDRGTTWIEAGSAWIHFCFTAGPPNPPGGDLREDALLEGSAAAMTGSTPEDGLRKLVADRLYYGGSITVLTDAQAKDDSILEAFQEPNVWCDIHAYALRYLAATLGIPAEVKYLWMGRPTEAWQMWEYSNKPEWYWFNFRCDRPAVDGLPKNPTFNFHALTAIGGVLHDPSYDLTGLPNILDSAQGAIQQLGSRTDFITAHSNIKYIGSWWP